MGKPGTWGLHTQARPHTRAPSIIFRQAPPPPKRGALLGVSSVQHTGRNAMRRLFLIFVILPIALYVLWLWLDP